MKKICLTLLTLSCMFVTLHAALSVGRPAAVKRRVDILDDKIKAQREAKIFANMSPTFNSITAVSTTAVENGTVQVSFSVSDPDGDSISYVWTSTAGVFSGTGASVNWRAPLSVGSFDITCTASDGRGGAVRQSISMAVVPPGTPRWSHPLPGENMDSSLAIAPDGALYAASYSANDNAGHLYALNPVTGAVNWVFTTNTLSPIHTSPVVSPSGNIYFGDDNGDLYAVDPSGSSLSGWPVSLGASVTSSAALGSAWLYVGTGDGVMHAIDPLTGAAKPGFSFMAPGGLTSSPSIGPDGTVYVGAGDGLHAIDPDTGAEKTGFPYATGDEVHSSPAIGPDGTVYFGSRDAFFYAIDPDGTLKWSSTGSDSVDVSPVIGAISASTYVYFGDSSSFYALSGENGSAAANWPMAISVTPRSSPAVGADGTVYIGSDDNNLYAIDPDGGPSAWPEVKWTVNGTKQIVSSVSIGAGGDVYFASSDGSDSEVSAIYDSNGLAAALWPKFRRTVGNTGR